MPRRGTDAQNRQQKYFLSEICDLQPSRKRGGGKVAINQGGCLLSEENSFYDIIFYREHVKND
jgi:hypothetical protein